MHTLLIVMGCTGSRGFKKAQGSLRYQTVMARCDMASSSPARPCDEWAHGPVTAVPKGFNASDFKSHMPLGCWRRRQDVQCARTAGRVEPQSDFGSSLEGRRKTRGTSLSDLKAQPCQYFKPTFLIALCRALSLSQSFRQHRPTQGTGSANPQSDSVVCPGTQHHTRMNVADCVARVIVVSCLFLLLLVQPSEQTR